MAILAIALQLVLSFAHIHPLPSQVSVIGAPAGNSAPDMPAAGDDCAICANIAAFASLDLPPHAAVPRPIAKAIVLVPVLASRGIRSAPIRHFSSRAPPAV